MNTLKFMLIIFRSGTDSPSETGGAGEGSERDRMIDPFSISISRLSRRRAFREETIRRIIFHRESRRIEGTARQSVRANGNLRNSCNESF